MIDIESNKPMRVHAGGGLGPYLFVPLPQMPTVEALLVAAEIPYSPSRDAVQIQGHGPIVMIDFSRRANAARIQAVLDAHDLVAARDE